MSALPPKADIYERDYHSALCQKRTIAGRHSDAAMGMMRPLAVGLSC
jgi:hypothetical protein